MILELLYIFELTFVQMAVQLASEICFLERSLNLPLMHEELLLLNPLYGFRIRTSLIDQDSRLLNATMSIAILKNRLVS